MDEVPVSLREDVYHDLERHRGDDESVSDVLERLLAAREGAPPADHPLYDLVGLLDTDEAEAMRERMAQFRAELESDFSRGE